MKKSFVSIALCIALLISSIVCANYAYADRANIKTESKNSWMSDIYIREGSTDFIKDPLYPDKTTFHKQENSFRAEVKVVKDLINIDISTLDSIYIDIINKAFNMVEGTSLDAQYSVMQEYLIVHWHVIYSDSPKATDKTYTPILYTVLKYDLMYPLNKTHFKIPKNTTLDRAMVLLVSEILSDPVDKNIDTLEKYAILNIKKSLVNNGYLESINDTVTDEELLLLYKIMIAENEGYLIPNHKVSTFKASEKEFVHNSYAAAVIKIKFKVGISPEKVGAELKSQDPDALEKLILSEMIREKDNAVIGKEHVSELLNKASNLGCFKLEDEFYSDIYTYDVYLAYECKDIWVTPFARAAELGKDKLKFLEITINGEKASHSRSTRVKIKKGTTKVIVKLKYKEENIKDTSKYIFRVHNGSRELPNTNLPVPNYPSYDDYNSSSLVKPDMGPPKFELKNTYNVIIDPFKVDLDKNHSIPALFSDLENKSFNNATKSKYNADNKSLNNKTHIKRVVTSSVSISAVALLICVLIFVILRKNNFIKIGKRRSNVKFSKSE